MLALLDYVRNLGDERGQTLVEYALIIVMVAIALVGALGLFAGGLDTFFSNVSDAFS